MDIAEQVAQIRREGQQAVQRHAAAAAGVAEAETRAQLAAEELRAEFGIGSLAEAEAALAQARNQVEAEAAQVRAQLQAAGGAR
jgi:hypothetical protein